MAFVKEQLTDEQREQMGFAKTMDDAKRGIRFVSGWAVDRERDAYLVATNKQTGWEAEFHWKNYTILIVTSNLVGTKIPEDIRIREEKKAGEHIVIFFRIIRLVIPEEIKDKFSEIESMIKEALAAHGWLGGIGYAELSPKLEIRFSKLIKSEILLRDFSTTH